MIELQTHTRRKNEKWASFGEDLRLLTDKGRGQGRDLP